MNNIIVSFITENDINELKPILQTEFDNFWNINNLISEHNNPNTTIIVAKINTEIVGFASIWKAYDIMHINNIVVKKSYRQKHIATTLLHKLIEITKVQNINELTLEVSDKNLIAISLYKKFNFKEIGKRKNYYGVNNNAIIMTLQINKEEFSNEKN